MGFGVVLVLSVVVWAFGLFWSSRCFGHSGFVVIRSFKSLRVVDSAGWPNNIPPGGVAQGSPDSSHRQWNKMMEMGQARRRVVDETC